LRAGIETKKADQDNRENRLASCIRARKFPESCFDLCSFSSLSHRRQVELRLIAWRHALSSMKQTVLLLLLATLLYHQP
jgi:cell division FtsZ-interacting protein ZapD